MTASISLDVTASFSLSTERFAAIEDQVAAIFGTTNDIVLMQGEAVLGLEAAARSLVRPGMTCLNLVSGFYGTWFGEWLEGFGAEVIEVAVPFDSAIEPDHVVRAFDENPGIELVAVVHGESLTGNVNPIREIGLLAKERGAITVVDVVASLGGHQVRPNDWGLDVCVAGPHKCLAGSPGVSMIAVSPAAWQAMASNPHAPRNSFLSLLDWKEKWVDTGRTRIPGTPSTAEMCALASACDRVLEEGLDAVIRRHQVAAQACRSGLSALGLELWVPEHAASTAVTVVRAPTAVPAGTLVELVRARYGVDLSTGFGEMRDKLVRIEHMGSAARVTTPVCSTAALARGLVDLGFPVPVGQGVEAVLDVLEKASTTESFTEVEQWSRQ